MHGCCHGNGRNLFKLAFQTLAEISFTQDNHWAGTAGPGQQQVTFDPINVKVVVEASDQKHCINVGSNHLFIVAFTSLLARKFAFALQGDFDQDGAAGELIPGVRGLCCRVADQNPVTNSGQFCLGLAGTAGAAW